MSNGNVLIIQPPQFEIYQTRISCSHDKEKFPLMSLESSVLSIKDASWRKSSINLVFRWKSTWLGTFVSTGTVHLIGLKAYTKLLRNHNHFLHTVTTVPLGGFQHTMLEIPFSMDASTNIDQTNLTEIIMSQPWCLSIEHSTTMNKVILLTTIATLSTTQTWVNDTLLALYKQHILDKLNVTRLTQIYPVALTNQFSYLHPTHMPANWNKAHLR